MLFQWFRRRQVEQHLSNMAMALSNRYGRTLDCTQGQVSTTLEVLNAKRFLYPYSHAVFLSKRAALRHFKGAKRYNQNLREIADLLFDGDLSEVRKFRKARRVGNSGHSSVGHVSEFSGGHDRA